MDPDQDSDLYSDPDADPDAAIFVIKKKFCLLLLEGTCTSFPKIKSQKEVTKQ
jgi:hypothetical protein